MNNLAKYEHQDNFLSMPYNTRDNFFDAILPTSPQHHKEILNRRSDDYIKSMMCITQKSMRKEEVLYPLVLTVLNMMSADIHDGEAPHTLALAFKTPSSTGPGSQWLDRVTKPDFVAEESSRDHLREVINALENPKTESNREIFSNCRFYDFIVSAGEGKKKQQSESGQLCTFALTVKQHRPDLTDVFCFFTDFEGFTIGRFNACGFVESVRQNWSQPEGLFQYVSALYTQTRESSLVFDDQSGCWKLSLGVRPYLLSPFYAVEGPGRMSMIFSACRELDKNEKPAVPLVVKLIWRDVKQRHEGDILRHLHRDGYVAGAVRIGEYFDLEGHVKDLDGHTTRRLSGLVMKSTGDPLSQCKSVYHFLCVMYDLVQTLENCAKQDVISCDVSWFNVLCNPKHAHHTESMWSGNGKSINEILGEPDTGYQCLLSDFDHGKILSEKRKGNIVERTGTPMFIPVEVVHDPKEGIIWTPDFILQKILSDLSSEQELVEKVGAPDLATKFLDLAPKYCTDDNYQDWPSLMPSTWEQNWEHLPRHELDSVFWIIVWWLSRVYPLNGDKEINSRNSRYVDWVEEMLHHQFPGVDPRQRFRSATLKQFKDLLHPEFSFLGDMIYSMSLYLAGPWAYIDNEPEDLWPQTHVHVVMKMLLLKEILKLKGNNPLPVAETPRPARSANNPDLYLKTKTSINTGSHGTRGNLEFKQLTEREPRVKPTEKAICARQVVEKAKTMRDKLSKDRLFFCFTTSV